MQLALNSSDMNLDQLSEVGRSPLMPQTPLEQRYREVQVLKKIGSTALTARVQNISVTELLFTFLSKYTLKSSFHG